MRRRKTRTRRRELGAAALAALCLSGCGEAKRALPHPPALPRSVATSLAATSDAVAAALARGDSCRALTLARRLQNATIGSINGGRVPVQLQEQLSASVNELVARVTCVPPRAAPAAGDDENKGDENEHRGKGGKKHKDGT